MSPTSEIIADFSLAHSYPELFQVTGPLPSLVLRAEDMWQRYNQCLEDGGALNQGFPFSPLMPISGVCETVWNTIFLIVFKTVTSYGIAMEDRNGMAGLGCGGGGTEKMCTLHAGGMWWFWY